MGCSTSKEEKRSKLGNGGKDKSTQRKKMKRTRTETAPVRNPMLPRGKKKLLGSDPLPPKQSVHEVQHHQPPCSTTIAINTSTPKTRGLTSDPTDMTGKSTDEQISERHAVPTKVPTKRKRCALTAETKDAVRNWIDHDWAPVWGFGAGDEDEDEEEYPSTGDFSEVENSQLLPSSCRAYHSGSTALWTTTSTRDLPK